MIDLSQYLDLIPRWILVSISAVPVLIGTLLYSMQSTLIYPSNFPVNSRTQVDSPRQYDLPFDRIELHAKDKVKLDAYFIKHPAPQLTVLYLHANAGNMGHRLPIAHQLYHRLSANILMLSYRGYGQSQGTPDEKGIHLDAQAALNWLVAKLGAAHKLVVFGQSIGGAVAIHLVQSNTHLVHGLMVENTFLSIPKLVPSVFPVLKYFTFLCHQIWPSYLDIVDIPSSIPILFLASVKDEIIPHSHMVELRALASLHTDARSGKNRVWVEFPNGTHNDTPMQAGYFEAIQAFVRSHVI